MQVSRYDLSLMILQKLGVKHAGLWRHIGARRAIVAWMGAESGWMAPCDSVHGAAYNPLNTILHLGNCSTTQYNTVPGVWNYNSVECGVVAVAQTLLTTPDKNYAPVVAALSQNFVRGITVLDRVAESGWGSFHNPDGSPDYVYAQEILDTYRRNKPLYNAALIGPAG